jgi:phage-related holin
MNWWGYIKILITNVVPYIVFFMSPIKWLMIGVGILTFLDLVTGIYAANKREKITSQKLARTIAKVMWFQMAILISRMFELIFVPGIPVAKITAGYIGLTEFKSNLENISEGTGIDIWNYVIDEINKLKGK